MNKLNKVLLLFVAAIMAAACSGNKQSEGDDAPRVLSLTGSGQYNKSLFLSIVDQTEQDTSFLYTVKGAFNGDTVGFYVSLDKEIPAGIDAEGSATMDGFKTGSIKFLRSGDESDRFIAVLASIWETEPAGNSFSAEAVLPLVFSSNNKAVDFSKPATHNFKLFFDPDAAEPGEIFFTHDTYHQRIELQEKDPAYRQIILDALAGVRSGGEE